MNAPTKFEGLDVGYDIPAAIGMGEADIQTPSLVLDLDALIPNSQMLGERVTNLTHGMGHSRIKVELVVPHDADPNQVEAILLSAADAHPDVLTEPAPFVWFTQFTPSSLDFVLVCFTSELRRRIGIASRMRFDIIERLREAGIEIPHAQQDVHIHGLPPKAED